MPILIAIINVSTGLVYLTIFVLVVAPVTYGAVHPTERWIGRWATIGIVILATLVVLSVAYHLVAAPIMWERHGECVGIWMEVGPSDGRSICVSPR